jgi:cation:H+ antiporter
VDVVLLITSFAVILAGALVFTNAIEWAGRRLSVGEGATGSVLAAVGTAMPETLIPIVAVIEGAEGADDVAVGAIIGAPFLLATIAMALVGISALIFKGRREQGTRLMADIGTLDRDLVFFLAFFAVGILAGVVVPEALHVPLAVVFALAYLVYVRQTLRGGGEVEEAEAIGPLYLDRSPGDEPPTVAIVLQLALGLAAIVGGAHLFVEELLTVAEDVGVDPLVLSLVLAPLATELPEKANSFFWVKDGKDSLALGNITGAMVFQSTIPIAFGLAFTDWDLDRFAVASGVLGLAGGALAYWALRLRRRFEPLPIAIWAGLFVTFLAYVTLTSGRVTRPAPAPRRRASSATPSGSRGRPCRPGR